MKILAVIAALVLTSCATIVSDQKSRVNIFSERPTDFAVYDEEGVMVYAGTTPSTVRLPNGNGYFNGADYTVSYAKETEQSANTVSPKYQVRFDDYGYTKTTPLDSELNAWYFGNFIIPGGMFGLFLIDPLTGAMWKLPESVRLY